MTDLEKSMPTDQFSIFFDWGWANRREKLMKAPYRIFSYPYKPEIMIFLHFFALFSDRKLVIKNDGFFRLFLNFAFCLFKKTEFLPAIFDLKKVMKTRVFCYFFRREKPCFSRRQLQPVKPIATVKPIVTREANCDP